MFRPVTTDVRGERRFISTIARRLDSLGALTRGQRQTGGQNLFDPADNLESRYAKDALVGWYHLLFAGKLGSVTLAGFQELTGLKLEGEDGGLREDLPPIQRWLNRLLALRIALQNAIFDEFLGLVEARVAAAREAGTLDLGVETVPVDGFEILDDRIIRTDPRSGATTHLLRIELARRLRPLSLERAARDRRVASRRPADAECEVRKGRAPHQGAQPDVGGRAADPALRADPSREARASAVRTAGRDQLGADVRPKRSPRPGGRKSMRRKRRFAARPCISPPASCCRSGTSCRTIMCR